MDMEDDSYSDLKSSLSSVPVKALNYSSRLKLANNLDSKQVLQSEKGYARDYRGLAELIGFQYHVIKKFEEFENRTMKILEEWETWPNATLDKLISHLEDMERYDVIQELIPSLKKNVEAYLDFQKSLESPIQVAEVTPGPMNLQTKKGVITRDDIQNGECTIYDAYVSYADEDSYIAADFARVLEHPSVGLKLFIRGRDMLAGCSELDSNIEMIKNRCRHMLIILTPNFIKSPALEFQVSFAGTLAIEQRQRILIPVIWLPCDEIPPILNSVSKIDFTKEYTHDWMMDKLISSLLPEEKIFLSSVARSPLKIRNGVPTTACSVSVESRPAITFPPSTKHFLSSANNSSPVLSITGPVEISDNKIDDDNKDSGACSEIKDEPVLSPPKSGSSSKLRNFLSHLKKKGNSTSVSSTSFSSGATSGFHSQSSSNIKSLDNSNDHCSDTSL